MRTKRRACKYYSVYLKKTDELVAQGSAEECTTQLGYTCVSTFYAMYTRSKQGKLNKYIFLCHDDGELYDPHHEEKKAFGLAIYKDYLSGMSWEDIAKKYGYASVSGAQHMMNLFRPTYEEVLTEWGRLHRKYNTLSKVNS